MSAPRLDRRGRRIGRNTWREAVVDDWSCAMHAWWLAAEDATALYDTELAEYEAEHPRPRLADHMRSMSHGADPLAA